MIPRAGDDDGPDLLALLRAPFLDGLEAGWTSEGRVSAAISA